MKQAIPLQSQTNFARFRLFRFATIAAVSLILQMGCAGADAGEEESSDIGRVGQAVMNGIVANQAGVVEVWVWTANSWSTCTGSLIGPRSLLMAASCLQMGVAISGHKWIALRYFDPTPPAVCENGSAPPCWVTTNGADLFKSMEVRILETFDGSHVVDAQDNMAILTPTNGFEFTDVTTADFLRVHSSSLNDIGQLEFYGAGYEGWSAASGGTGAGVLRKMPISVNGSRQHVFWDLAGSRRVCIGDAGGPVIGTSNGFDVIAGIHGNAQLAALVDLDEEEIGNPVCAKGGVRQNYARMSSRIDWIQNHVPGGCDAFNHYIRCFNP